MNFSTGSVKVVMNSVLITAATMQSGRNPHGVKGQHLIYQLYPLETLICTDIV